MSGARVANSRQALGLLIEGLKIESFASLIMEKLKIKRLKDYIFANASYQSFHSVSDLIF